MSVSSLGLVTARADEKADRRSKQYKIGAAVLGGAAVYFGLKKKNPVAAAAAGAGAYYAYKKGQDIKNKSERYGYDNSDIGNVYADAGNVADDVYTPGSDAYPDDNGAYGDGSYSSDYGYGTATGNDYGNSSDEGYASNDDQYPDYSLRGLKSGSKSGLKSRAKTGSSAKVTRRASRIVVK